MARKSTTGSQTKTTPKQPPLPTAEIVHLGARVEVLFGVSVGGNVYPFDPLQLTVSRLDDAAFNELRDAIYADRQAKLEGVQNPAPPAPPAEPPTE